ncbi:MAG: hypothetical protein E7287_07150 [Lachnospiraceae bacterium]|nr:hypothetical protein [Lachnospiraceae bacterium]
MSSNLLKRGNANVQQDEVRVIEVNALMARRIEALGLKVEHPGSGDFVAGMPVQSMDADGVLDEFEEGLSGNVIKMQSSSEMTEQSREELSLAAEQILEEAREQARQIVEEAVAQAEAEKNTILEEARAQGYQDGKESARQENEKLAREYAEKKEALEEEYNQLVERLEPGFIDTLTDIYEHIFHVELHSYREILVYLISSTLRKIDGNRTFYIHVSKEDYPYVSMQKKQMAAGAASPSSSIEIVEDNTLSKNECLIETENGVFDCGLGTQLAELKQKLMLLSYEK